MLVTPRSRESSTREDRHLHRGDRERRDLPRGLHHGEERPSARLRADRERRGSHHGSGPGAAHGPGSVHDRGLAMARPL